MTLGLLGDIHGHYSTLDAAIQKCKARGDVTALIQLGDFGWYPQYQFFASLPQYFDFPIYWIDGNHEDHDALTYVKSQRTVTEMRPNLFFVPRGTLLTLDNRTIAFVGGAGSVDKNLRIAQKLDWYAEEIVTPEDVARLDQISSVDLLLTHTPPQRTIEKCFSRSALAMFGAPYDWTDPSAVLIDVLWDWLGQPPLYCGHMHRKVTDGNIRILDIDELLFI